MRFNNHSQLEGRHAFLSASKYHWVNYSDEKMDSVFLSAMAAAKGTELHDIAAKLIKHRIKQAKVNKTFNMYVNDAIGWGLKPEQVLFYSENCFGTADAIGYMPKPRGKDVLRISDLKTGVTPGSVHQLEVYAAMFFLEYGAEYKIRPHDVTMELRIYQNDEIVLYEADPGDIVHIMDRIVTFDKRIRAMREEMA